MSVAARRRLDARSHTSNRHGKLIAAGQGVHCCSVDFLHEGGVCKRSGRDPALEKIPGELVVSVVPWESATDPGISISTNPDTPSYSYSALGSAAERNSGCPKCSFLHENEFDWCIGDLLRHRG